jgi:muconolactone D-isomerase
MLLFRVAITVRTPLGMDAKEIKRLGALEHERAAELQHQGKWLHLWRIVGQWANISVNRPGFAGGHFV